MPPIIARRRAGLVALAAAALSVAAVPAQGAVPTFERTLLTAGERPDGAAIGPIDGDARPDVLVTNLFSHDVSVFRNAGAVAFDPARSFSLGGVVYPDDPSLADFDGDGDLDAVTIGATVLTVSRNDAGALTPAQTLPMGRYVQAAAAGDLDGDGMADVVASYHEVMGDAVTGGLRVFLAGDDGVLAEHEHHPLTAALGEVALEDVDGDGDRDLLYGERFRVGPTWTGATDGVVVKLGDGAGGFGERTLYDAADLQMTDAPMLLDDTGDGIEDLVAGHGNANQLSVWPGNGDGTFGAHRARVVAHPVHETATGDVDRDGHEDFVATNGLDAELYLGGPERRSITLDAGAEHPYGAALGDLDGDGWLDMVVATSGPQLAADPLNPDTVAVFRNTSAPAPGPDPDPDPDPEPEPEPVPPLPFTGFFAPVDNAPTLTGVRAGSAVPVKFSLAGFRGMDVLAAGYPRSQEVACDATAPVDGIEETVSPGASALGYDAQADRYQVVWKTSELWAGTCRQLVVKLRDGSAHRATFRLR